MKKVIKLLLCLCAAAMLLPMTVLAGMGNNSVMSGTGTWGIDIDNNQNGVIVSGTYTKTVYNKGGLIVGGNFTNPIVDDGTGRYGLQLQLSNVTAELGADIYEYKGIKYGIMPYSSDFSFTLTADNANGFTLPKSISITRAGTELSPGTDYFYDSVTGAVKISGLAINYPLVLEVSGKIVESGVEINEGNFPDPVFRKYIQDNFDTNDSEVLTDDEIKEIKTINVGLQTATTTIKNLKGIELFPYLQELYCLDLTQLPSIDISANKALKWLNIEGAAQISTLDVEQNQDLEYLNCAYTSITNLELSNNKKLKQLYINGTGIESLELKENKNLEVLNCFGASKITNLDLSNKTVLSYLEIGGTGVKEIDTSGSPLLSSFFCSNTQITYLDVSHNSKLSNFECRNNQLGYLNLGVQSINTALLKLDTQVTAELTIKGNEFDITEKFKGIDPTKINVIKGGELNGNLMSNYHAGTPIVYEYDCGTNKGEAIILQVTLNLVKSESSIIINKNLDKVYDGKPVVLTKDDLVITGSKGAVSFIWEMYNGNDWEKIQSAPINAGTYRVTAYVEEDENCGAGNSEAKEFTISKQEEHLPKGDSGKDKKVGGSVQTGDTSPAGMFLALSVLSGIVIVLLICRKRKFNVEHVR